MLINMVVYGKASFYMISFILPTACLPLTAYVLVISELFNVVLVSRVVPAPFYRGDIAIGRTKLHTAQALPEEIPY